MPKSQLPWRTLAPAGPSGRLDPALLRKAILEVKAESEAKARERKRARKPGKPGKPRHP